MLGNLRLRNAENFLKVANAKRTTCKQMDDPQPRGVAETLCYYCNLPLINASGTCVEGDLPVTAIAASMVRLDCSIAYWGVALQTGQVARSESELEGADLCSSAEKMLSRGAGLPP
jgi:hypothetical protein